MMLAVGAFTLGQDDAVPAHLVDRAQRLVVGRRTPAYRWIEPSIWRLAWRVDRQLEKSLSNFD